MTLTLVVPDRSALAPSGGDRYDAALVAQWRRLGREVEVVAAAGSWPWPGAEDLTGLEERVGSVGGGPVLLDGLVGCSAPEVVIRSAAVRPTAVLVHSLLADGAGATGRQGEELDRRERRALAAAQAVITTSRWACEQLAVRHGIPGATVATPGTSPAPVSPGSLADNGTPVLLSLGAVTPLKNHGVLLAALHQVSDLPWTLVVAGPAPDPDHLAGLVADAARRGLAERITWAGTLVGEPLEAVWGRTDLLVHPSRSETYGMVVAEAHAHGIPAVVGAGTGAVEALNGSSGRPEPGQALPGTRDEPGAGAPPGTDDLPGAAVRTDGPDELAAVLRRWLADGSLRGRWRESALARRNLLGGWGRTVEQIDRALDRISP